MNDFDEKIKLSPIDKRILSVISKEGFKTERQLAEKLRLSQTTVNYKLKRLEANRVIEGYRFRLDTYLLGYTASAYAFFVLKRGLKISDVMKKLAAYPETKIVLLVSGDYDLCVKLVGRSQEHIFELVSRIGNEQKALLRHGTILFSVNSFKKHNIPVKQGSQIRLNNAEAEILKLRINEPELKLSEVAKKLGMHRNTVSGKWNEFWEKGLVLKKSALINPLYYPDIGIGFTAFLSVDAEMGSVEKLMRFFLEREEVHELSQISSRPDLLAFVRTKDITAFASFFKDLHSNPQLVPYLLRIKANPVLDSLNKKPTYEEEINHALKSKD